MTQTNPHPLKQTPLHGWHSANGARMVPFAGYDMPVQYPNGIIKEHLATRTGAGLFDVSHMGRFRVRGRNAGRLLGQVLSGHVAALDVGQAQYGFLATADGGAVDDTYLYRIAGDDYLLVVNASNREKDWQWINEHSNGDADISDDSERLAMIALQGPNSQSILASLTDESSLPAGTRNTVAECDLLGQSTLVARTGYTGESMCFELFPSADAVAPLWAELVARGATAVGLGARDSLRLQAGLPLYGHELGDDRDGHPIPIFANALARFGVRAPGNGEFIGRAALDAQREEFDRIRNGEMEHGFSPQRLTHQVQPVVVLEGRRPLRAGHTVFAEDTPVGYLTSGAVVPVIGDAHPDSDATVEHSLRPVGLALIEAQYRFRKSEHTLLEARDDRGKGSAIKVVARLPR